MLFVGVAVLIIEAVAGFWSGSLSLLADAAHLGTDIASDGVALVIAYIVVLSTSTSKEDKIRTVGGCIQALLLGALGLLILEEALIRLESPRIVNPIFMIVAGSIAAAGNWWRHKILHSGIQPQYKHVTHWGQLFHVLTDLGYSVAVTIGGILIFITGKNYLDVWFSLIMVGVAWILAITTIILAFKKRPSS